MTNEEFLVNAIIKTFKGTIVENYPCKGVKMHEATPDTYSEGLRSVNPRTVERNKKEGN
jgi:hypothetical protein